MLCAGDGFIDRLRGASSPIMSPPPLENEGMLRVAICEWDMPEPPLVAGDDAGNLITSTRSNGEPDLRASAF